MNHIRVGEIGEKCAAEYLSSKGWQILTKNYRLKFGEIDIVAKDPLGCIVFVEVKSLSGVYPSGFSPEDNLSQAKLLRFRRICRMFSAKHSYLFQIEGDWRMDFIAITFIDGKKAIMRHYTNI
jgi:Holliday junction resolvase-like predicted endonuclease